LGETGAARLVTGADGTQWVFKWSPLPAEVRRFERAATAMSRLRLLG
jgi:hypothetical protein